MILVQCESCRWVASNALFELTGYTCMHPKNSKESGRMIYSWLVACCWEDKRPNDFWKSCIDGALGLVKFVDGRPERILDPTKKVYIIVDNEVKCVLPYTKESPRKQDGFMCDGEFISERDIYHPPVKTKSEALIVIKNTLNSDMYNLNKNIEENRARIKRLQSRLQKVRDEYDETLAKLSECQPSNPASQTWYKNIVREDL